MRRSDEYWFLCEISYNVEKKDLFCNSLVLKENTEIHRTINLNTLPNKKSYQKIFLQGKIHVICDSLDLTGDIHV